MGNLRRGILAPAREKTLMITNSYICRYDNKHIDYKPDPRKAHDGTIEFTSIDAHMGCGEYLSLYFVVTVDNVVTVKGRK